jgi:hypothetical protein
VVKSEEDGDGVKEGGSGRDGDGDVRECGVKQGRRMRIVKEKKERKKERTYKERKRAKERERERDKKTNSPKW